MIQKPSPTAARNAIGHTGNPLSGSGVGAASAVDRESSLKVSSSIGPGWSDMDTEAAGSSGDSASASSKIAASMEPTTAGR